MDLHHTSAQWSIQEVKGLTSVGRTRCITDFLFCTLHWSKLKFCVPTSHTHSDLLKWLFVILVTTKNSLANRRTQHIVKYRHQSMRLSNQDFETNCKTRKIQPKILHDTWFLKDHWSPGLHVVGQVTIP